MQVRALVRHLDADHRAAAGAVLSSTHDGPPLVAGLGVELEQGLLEHRRPEGGAGPVVVDRGALAAAARPRPRARCPRSRGGRAARPRWRWPAAGWRPRRRARWRPARRRRPATSSAKAMATLEMSSNRRLAILWKATVGASGSGMRTARISSPGSFDGLPVAGEVRRPAATSRSPSGPASTIVASSASSAGGASPMGEPVPRLPPRVAPLRISRDANCGHSWSSSGIRPSSSRSASDRVSAAPISMLGRRRRRTCAARAAGRRPPRTGPGCRAG